MRCDLGHPGFVTELAQAGLDPAIAKRLAGCSVKQWRVERLRVPGRQIPVEGLPGCRTRTPPDPCDPCPSQCGAAHQLGRGRLGAGRSVRSSGSRYGPAQNTRRHRGAPPACRGQISAQVPLKTGRLGFAWAGLRELLHNFKVEQPRIIGRPRPRRVALAT